MRDQTLSTLFGFGSCLALCLAACGDSDSSGDNIDASTQTTIQFSARVTGTGNGGGGGGSGSGQEAACGETFANQGSSDATIEFIDIRLYVSNVRLINDQNAEIPLVLDTTSAFQTGTTTLLDFENATGKCDGTAETNTTVTGTIANGSYQGIVFDLGVPFADNHADVTAASTPLNVMSMYWAWLTGHKFAKIDVVDDQSNRWNFHLGATNCSNNMMGGSVPPTVECARPNRPSISLTNFDPATDTINIDLGALFDDSDLAANTAMTPPGCQSFLRPDAQGMTDPDCTNIFAKVGLDLDTGTCTNDCADQSVFKVAP